MVALIPTSHLLLPKKRLLLYLIQLIHQGLERGARVVQRQRLQTLREHWHEACVLSRPAIGRSVQRNKDGAEVVPGSPRQPLEMVHIEVTQGLNVIALKRRKVIFLLVQALEKVWRKGEHRMQARARCVRV